MNDQKTLRNKDLKRSHSAELTPSKRKRPSKSTSKGEQNLKRSVSAEFTQVNGNNQKVDQKNKRSNIKDDSFTNYNNSIDNDNLQYLEETSVKCVVVGDGTVGKTSALICYCKGEFIDDYVCSLNFNHLFPTYYVRHIQTRTTKIYLFND
eukprot:TRINITY_DN191_c0_g1_i1.p1 TRINITY_DN191_c0_g1~~TRINITY_DN191_c0_g1_i1.p1  ORF type:complete len:150 (-),score=13.11 TRINITY_DN191_c0_g1_i1:415-864(-)